MSHNREAAPRRRVVRVFVSSTFRDMKEERDELVRDVFPQLRRICEKRGVVWGEVDLRWGITDEEKAEGKVLPICLEEIRSCRPYFIGMLGERYGWVPFEIPKELLEREEWLREHLEKSVTELEILHGVLNDPEMADHAYFYFRDPAWVESKSKEERGEFLEGPTVEELRYLGPQDAEHRAELRRRRLADLKERLRSSGLPVRENYRNPEQLGELVLQDFTELIDRLFPEGSEPDPLDKDATEHEAFAQSRFRVYIGRPEYFDLLDEHAGGDGPPLVILGESGSGKSALLANWAEVYRDEHPDVLLIRHFTGATPYSTDWAAMLRRIMEEFRRRFDIQGDVPAEPDKLRTAFANRLHMAAARGRVILILDALNQLEDRDGAPDLVWLPPFIPPGIRIFLSTLAGRPLDDLKKRGWPTIEVKPLTTEERKQLIFEYLARYRKSMTKAQSFWISNAEQTANPLYLRALLDELRILGEHERLEDQIEQYLSADTVPRLFEKILERYEKDYERERPGLVREAMAAIWASRRGLTEAELLEILGDDGNPLPQAIWAPLALAAERSLTSRSGLMGFSHEYMRQAVKNRYLQTEESEQAAHLRLADYFTILEITPRKVDELSWQLAEAKAWQRLCDLLVDLEFLEEAWVRNQFDVKAFWARIEGGSELRMVSAYRKLLDSPIEIMDATAVMDLSILLSETGHSSEALLLEESLAGQFRRTGDHSRLQACLGSKSNMLYLRGDLDGAMKLLKEQELICRELGNANGLSRSLNLQATILMDWGDPEEARRLLKEQEQICRELGDPAELSMGIQSQAVILMDCGDMDSAMSLLKEGERIFRELGNPDGLSRSLNNQGLIQYQRGDLDGAMKLHKEVERMCRELGDPGGIYRSLNNQALIFKARGDPDGAMKLLKEMEQICREMGDKDGFSRSLGNQALILKSRGDLDGAMRLLKEQERITRELNRPAGLEHCLNNQASILKARGDLDGAMSLLKEAERICREVDCPSSLYVCLGNQTSILMARGDVDGAMRLLKEVERICRDLGRPAGLQESLGCQAVILENRGDLDGAMKLLKEQERICCELGLFEGLAGSLARQGEVLAKQGQPMEGLAFAEEAYRMATEHGYALIAAEIKPILDDIRLKLEKQVKE